MSRFMPEEGCCQVEEPKASGVHSEARSPLSDSSYLTIIENSSDIIARFDRQSRCLYVNRSIARYLPTGRAQQPPPPRQEPEWPAAWSQLQTEAVARVFEQMAPHETEWIVKGSGANLVFATQLFPEMDTSGACHSVLCIAREVTQVSQTRRLLAEENAVLEMIADSRPIDHILTKLSQMIEAQLGDGICAIMRLAPCGQRLSLVAAPSLPPAFRQVLDGVDIGPHSGASGAAAFWKHGIIVSDVAASPLWNTRPTPPTEHGLLACWATPIFDSQQMLQGILTLYYRNPRSPTPDELRLIYRCSHLAAIALQRQTNEARLYQLATEDGLTRLFNRRHFIESAERMLSQAHRYEHAVTVIMVDIDHFKRINDQYGHATGDQVLEQFGLIFRQTMRESDIVGRLGGEEFAALLPATPLGQALSVAERLRSAVEATPLTDGRGRQVIFQVSVGVAAWAVGESLDKVLARADKMLYQAKNEGRNRVCLEVDTPPSGDDAFATPREISFSAGLPLQTLQC